MTAKRIVILIAVIVFGPLVIEGIASAWLFARDVRAFVPPPTANFRQAAYDSLLGWKATPNMNNPDNYGPGLSVTTNADGFRLHRPLEKTPTTGEPRIMCSGASFTWGSGVKNEDTFCARLEVELPGVRTINVAQQGYGFDQSYLLYRRDGAAYPHQLQLFVINATDFERTASNNLSGYPKPGLALKDGKLEATHVPVPQWTGWSRWTEIPKFLPSLRLMQFLKGRLNVSEEAQYQRVDAQLWPVLEPMLRDLARLNKERGSVPVLVYLPTVEEFASHARDARRTRLLKSAGDAGIATIDLTPPLRALPADSVAWLFLTPNAIPSRGHSGHYNATGNRWVARELAAKLREFPVTAAVAASRTLTSRGP
jgi:hypothetical protein